MLAIANVQTFRLTDRFRKTIQSRSYVPAIRGLIKGVKTANVLTGFILPPQNLQVLSQNRLTQDSRTRFSQRVRSGDVASQPPKTVRARIGKNFSGRNGVLKLLRRRIRIGGSKNVLLGHPV
jgi:hypothetical protein